MTLLATLSPVEMQALWPVMFHELNKMAMEERNADDAVENAIKITKILRFQNESICLR